MSDDSDSLTRLSTEHFRIGMRFRVVALSLIAGIHIVLAVVATHTTAYGNVGIREALRFLVPNVGVHLSVIGLNLWALRRSAATGRFYAMVARLSLVGEAWTGATGLWLMGSVEGSYSPVFIALLIPVYRTFYGRELGLWALALVVGFHGGLVGLDSVGITQSGWGNPSYEPPSTVGGALSILAIYWLLYLLVWVASTANARRSEQLRALRRQLAKLLDKRKRFGPLSATLLDGRYELGALLGRGGMGDVYRARDRHDDTDVAIKVLHPLFAEDRQMLERFRREADAIAKLTIAGIPRVFRVAVQAAGQSFIVMQLLEGESLADTIEREGVLAPARVQGMVHDLASVLDRLHDAGIVHRDLKPSNVHLVPTASGSVQAHVLDFGVAKLRERAAGLTRTEMLLGTIGYIAPECVQNDSSVATAASDVFAMAAIAYEALTGEPAFSTRDLGAFAHDVLHRVPTSVLHYVPDLSPDVDVVLQRGMAREPQERFGRASDFAHALARALVATREATAKEQDAPRLEAGVVIAGRYRLDRHLGSGGMGTVWAATHTMTRRAVAMKFLLTTGREPELRARLVREAAAAGMLDHPNVVRVFDVFDFEDGSPVVVMELLVGETLADKLAREGPLGLEETARLLLPVISAVGAAHALGVVHRDLKPANVFLTTSGAETRVKVLDFGLAKLAQSPSAISAITDLRTATGRVLGSPGYMAPEQVEGAHVDPSMDVWSTGVILYECLSGIRPIEGSNLVEIRERLLHDGIIPIEELMPELPRDVSDLVSRMLSRDPGRRLQGFVEIGELLRRHASPRAPSDSSLRIARG